MAASFRARIFRLLLLFAAVPSVALTVVGFYLASDPAITTTSDTPSGAGELRDYFYDLLYEDIGLALDDFLAHGIDLDDRLDFTLRIDSSVYPAATDTLPRELYDRLQEMAPRQENGLVEINARFYQYVARRTADGGYLVGGLVHDSSLAAAVRGGYGERPISQTQRELRATYLIFLGFLFLGLALVTILAAYLFSSRVSRNLAEPVAALSRASKLIAAGDFKQEIKLTADGEIGLLVNNFNRMAAELDRVSSRLVQTERVAAWRQVARRFAHELKNPLQPILVSLYRLEQQLSNTKIWSQVEESLRAAREEVQHLTRLAERFSTLARLPAPSVQEVDLSELATSTLALYREKLAPFKFEYESSSEPIIVQTDPGFVREAVHNLLQNSIDACRPGDQIGMTLTATDAAVEFVVKDTGRGMDRQTLASARLPYFTTKSKGNGLGLAIVERSMAELGGQLKVASDPGTGTLVTLVLPRKNN